MPFSSGSGQFYWVSGLITVHQTNNETGKGQRRPKEKKKERELEKRRKKTNKTSKQCENGGKSRASSHSTVGDRPHEFGCYMTTIIFIAIVVLIIITLSAGERIDPINLESIGPLEAS